MCTWAQATKSKSALPILKATNLKSPLSAVGSPATDDRRRGHWASFPSRPHNASLRVARHNSKIKRHLSALRIICHTTRRTKQRTTIVPSGTTVDLSTLGPPPASSTIALSPSQQSSDPAVTPGSISVAGAPGANWGIYSTIRPGRPFFRRQTPSFDATSHG